MIIDFFATLLSNSIWTPSPLLMPILLVLGALFIAAVALLIISYYEDYYWNDVEYRRDLRWHPARRKENI